MRNKVFARSTDEILKEADAILASNEDAEFHYKVTVVSIVLRGMSIKDVADSLSVDVRAVQKWVKAADEQGFDSLRPRTATGRPRLLTEEQKAWLKTAVHSAPETYGYNVWDGKSVANLIKKKYDIGISVRSCQYLLRELGLSVIRPQTQPNHQKDQSPREDFKKN